MKKIVIAAALALSATPAAAQYQMTHYLVAQWFENGNQMCRYDNGTVLNMGHRLCPLSIKG
jgi:hypothetical protein